MTRLTRELLTASATATGILGTAFVGVVLAAPALGLTWPAAYWWVPEIVLLLGWSGTYWLGIFAALNSEGK